MTNGKTEVQMDEVTYLGRTASAGRGWETTCVRLTPEPLLRTSFLPAFIYPPKRRASPLLVPPHPSPSPNTSPKKSTH